MGLVGLVENHKILSPAVRGLDVSVAIHIPSSFILVVYLTTLSVSRLYSRIGRAIPQAVSRRLPTAAALL
jgi:hypothetical protein